MQYATCMWIYFWRGGGKKIQNLAIAKGEQRIFPGLIPTLNDSLRSMINFASWLKLSEVSVSWYSLICEGF